MTVNACINTIWIAAWSNSIFSTHSSHHLRSSPQWDPHLWVGACHFFWVRALSPHAVANYDKNVQDTKIEQNEQWLYYLSYILIVSWHNMLLSGWFPDRYLDRKCMLLYSGSMHASTTTTLQLQVFSFLFQYSYNQIQTTQIILPNIKIDVV